MKYREIAPLLFERGWRNAIPLTHEKGTFAKWAEVQRRDMTEKTLAYYVERYGDAPRTGLVFGPARELVGIDIDVLDRDEAQLVQSIVMETLPRTDFIRIGREPKYVLLYKGRITSRKPIGLHIEVFGSSGQIAAFGPHPSAGVDYRWKRRSPLDATPDDLPPIRQDQVDAFVDRVSERIKRADPTRDRNTGRDLWEILREERQQYGLDAARWQLEGIQIGERYNVLLSVVGYLVGKLGYSPAEVGEFVDRHFPTHARIARDRVDRQFADVRAFAEQLADAADTKFFAPEDFAL